MTFLHRIGDAIRSVLQEVPLWGARALFVALPLALLVWVITLPRSETSPPEGARGTGGNLKLWASIALGAQVLIYLVL